MTTLTTETIDLQASPNASPRFAEFGRWRDVERIFGIKRGVLYQLLNEGKVKSVTLRRKGNMHGCRLFYLPSIAAYLSGLLAEQNPEPVNQPTSSII